MNYKSYLKKLHKIKTLADEAVITLHPLKAKQLYFEAATLGSFALAKGINIMSDKDRAELSLSIINLLLKAEDFVQAINFAKSQLDHYMISGFMTEQINTKIAEIESTIKKHSQAMEVNQRNRETRQASHFPMLLQDACIYLQFTKEAIPILERFIMNQGDRFKLIKQQCQPIPELPIIESWPTFYRLVGNDALLLSSEFTYMNKSKHLKNEIIKKHEWRNDFGQGFAKNVRIGQYLFKIF